MQRGSFIYYALITLLILVIFGVVSLGDVLSVVGYVILGVIVLVLIAAVVVSYRINRLRRRMDDEGETGSYNTWSFGTRQRHSQRKEGDVTIEKPSQQGEKRVNDKVGDYVDFEEVDQKKDNN